MVLFGVIELGTLQNFRGDGPLVPSGFERILICWFGGLCQLLLDIRCAEKGRHHVSLHSPGKKSHLHINNTKVSTQLQIQDFSPVPFEPWDYGAQPWHWARPFEMGLGFSIPRRQSLPCIALHAQPLSVMEWGSAATWRGLPNAMGMPHKHVCTTKKLIPDARHLKTSGNVAQFFPPLPSVRGSW